MHKIVIKISLLVICILNFSLSLNVDSNNFYKDYSKENQLVNNNNSSIINNESFADPASMALWLILILIFVPFFMIFMLFYICCKCICDWDRPIYHHHEYARPIIIQPQPSSQNFNA